MKRIMHPKMLGHHFENMFLAVSLFLLMPGKSEAFAQPGMTNEGPFTILRTGSSEPLLTLRIPLFVPQGDPAPQLRFSFGFSTEEIESRDTFFDSFSLTLQNSNQTSTALLFTSDRTGTQWAPPNPGGLTISPSSIDRRVLPFPNFIQPSLPLRESFEVTFSIPREFLNQTNLLFFDLFDNQNTNRSLAFVRSIQLLVPIWLQSSARPEGPFALEDGFEVDSVAQTLSIPKFSRGRYYRIRSDFQSRVTSMAVDDQNLRLSYQFLPANLRLQSAPSQSGTFQEVTNAVLDLPRQQFSVPNSTQPVVYRVVSDGPVVITSLETNGGQVAIHFEFRPVRFLLESSAQAAGPYAVETGYSHETSTRTIRMLKTGVHRFFRVSSVLQYRIVRLESAGDRWLLHYQSTVSN